MKECRICKRPFDPEALETDPALEAGAFMAKGQWGDEGQLCPQCLRSRGILGMMYCREFYG